MTALHIVQGRPDPHFQTLKRAASGNGSLRDWTVPRSARRGDRVFFYLVKPVSSFVASGVLAADPKRNEDKSDQWYGHYYAPIRKVLLLPTPVRIDEVRNQLPDWGYLRNVRVGTTIPAHRRASFEKALGLSGMSQNDTAEVSDFENIQTETRILARSRSRRLRDAAFQEAAGVCAVCERDFSKILGGRGVRVLQVHHRKQLRGNDRPRLTKLKELAVLCANCHLLVHLDPARALSVPRLKKMLAM